MTLHDYDGDSDDVENDDGTETWPPRDKKKAAHSILVCYFIFLPFPSVPFTNLGQEQSCMVIFSLISLGIIIMILIIYIYTYFFLKKYIILI